MQQTNAENRPRADISYTFVAQAVTKKDVCTHVGYAEYENGVSPCEWIYNQRPTSWILASHIKDSFDLKQIPFCCHLPSNFLSIKENNSWRMTWGSSSESVYEYSPRTFK